MIENIFEFEDWGLSRGSMFRMSLKNNLLAIERKPNANSSPTIQKVEISNEELDKFMNVLDSIDIWKWEPEYRNPGVFDGDMWSLKAKKGQLSINSKGDNNYPYKYDKLHSAIHKLIKEKIEKKNKHE